MRTLHLHLTRQVLATLAMTVLVFTFVLLLASIIKEILPLLINQQATFSMCLKAIGLLLPFLLAYSLPMGMLAATLLVFGRFSADQELTAVRASGISLISLVSPILLLSVVASALCLFVNLQLAPYCRAAYKDLFYSVATRSPTLLFQEKQFVADLPGGYTVYVDKREGDVLHGVYMHEVNQAQNYTRWIRADSARLVFDETTMQLHLSLTNAHGAEKKGDDVQPFSLKELPLPFDAAPSKNKIQETKLSDMTFWELRKKIRELELAGPQSFPLPHNATPEQLRQIGTLKVFLADWSIPAKVQLHRMVSFSFACIGFTLIGIPLGIRAHRRETSIGIAIALGLVVVYYSFLVVGQSLEARGDLAPHLIVWLPNFVFQAVGSVLLWRANRGV
jgi:lipopolysaccharide export system permease protein